MEKKHKRIKILYTIPNFDTAGSGKAMLEVATRLDKDVFEPHIMCLHDKGIFFEVVKKSGIPIYIYDYLTPMRPILSGIAGCYKKSKFFKKHKFDIVHSFHYGPEYSEALAVRMAGIKWMFTKKNMNWGGSSANSWKVRSFLSHHIAVQNHDMEKLFYPKSKKTTYLPCGVNTKEFLPQEPDVRILKEFNIEEGTPIVINVAHMVPIKGIDVLVKAFAEIENKKAKLFLVGNDTTDTGKYIYSLVEELGLSDRVIFTGKRMDVASFLSIATVFVLSTLGKGEGSPVAVLEAMASRVPVIGSYIPGVRDQLADFKELMFEAGNSSELASRIDYILSLNSDEMENLRDRVLKTIQDHYTIEREVAQYEQIYKQSIE